MFYYYRYLCFFLLTVLVFNTGSIIYAQSININPDKKSNELITLSTYWKYHSGDGTTWSNPAFDDSLWDTLPISLNLNKIPKGSFDGICWFRQTIKIDSSLINKPLGLIVSHYGASEIYFNGELIKKFGKVGLTAKEEIAFQPKQVPHSIFFDRAGEYVVAIRYSNHQYKRYLNKYEQNIAGFSVIEIQDLDSSINNVLRSHKAIIFIFSIFIGVLDALAFIHLLLFFFYKKNKSNLYYSLFVFVYSLLFTIIALITLTHTPEIEIFLLYLLLYLNPLLFLLLITFLYSLFYKTFPKIFWVIVGLAVISLLFVMFYSDLMTLAIIVLIFMASIESIRVIIRALIKKQRGAKILGFGVLSFILFIVGTSLIGIMLGGITIGSSFLGNLVILFIVLALFSIPISMSIYLAKNFSDINKDLQDQKDKLEIRVKGRTHELEKQKNLVEEKNKEILDSITYAKRIQSAILPQEKLIKSYLPETFIFYKPKDIVAGDFYWMESLSAVHSLQSSVQSQMKTEDCELILFAAADCTGHGVPGAMVSVVCNNALNRSVREYKLTEPGKILDKTREIVIQEFEKSEEDVKDGMDISLCSLKFKVQGLKLTEPETSNPEPETAAMLQYAGANNPLWIIRPTVIDGSFELIEYKPNKQPIGKVDNPQLFTTHTIDLQKGDTIYIFTDGYADQFGGERGKKMMYKPFKELLISMQAKTMDEQKELLDHHFENWKGNLEQIDDVCVIGVKIC